MGWMSDVAEGDFGGGGEAVTTHIGDAIEDVLDTCGP